MFNNATTFGEKIKHFVQMGGDTVHPISKKIYDVLKERNISNAEMARMVGIGRSTFSRWFSSDIEPKATTVKKIAEKLELPYSYFLKDYSTQDFIVELEDEYPTYFETLRKKIPNSEIIHYEKVFSRMLDLSKEDQKTIESLIDRLSEGDK